MIDTTKALPRISVIKQTEHRRTSLPRALSMNTLELVDTSRLSDPVLEGTSDDNVIQDSAAATHTQAELDSLRNQLTLEYEEQLNAAKEEHKRLLDEYRDECDRELLQIRDELAIALRETSDSTRQYMLDAQAPLTELCTAVAEALLGTSIDEQQAETIRASISWAVDELARDQSIDVYLNPSTMQVVTDNTSTLDAAQGQNIRWHLRPELAPEDWVASSPETAIRRVRIEVLNRIDRIISASLSSERPEVTTKPEQPRHPSDGTVRAKAPDAPAIPRTHGQSNTADAASRRPHGDSNEVTGNE